MTQLIVDGLATYGVGSVLTVGGVQSPVRLAMLSGAWADVRESITSPDTQIGPLPFGTDTSLYYGGPAQANSGGGGGYELRRAIPTAGDEIIVSMRFAAANLPALANVCGICVFRNASNDTIALLTLQPTGQLALFQKGTNLAGPNRVLLLQTQSPVIVAESSQHLEMRIKVTTGVFQLYVDGVQVMNGAGLTFGAAGPVALLAFTTSDANSQQFFDSTVIYFTDLIVRNTAGSYNNTIMGDRRVATCMVNADDPAHQGWTPHPLQRFGNAILASPAGTGAVTCAATTATDLGSGDYTLEGNFRFNKLPAGSNLATLFGKWGAALNQRSYRLYLGGPLLDSGALTYQCSTDGTNGGVVTLFQWPWKPETGRWYHVALSRVSGQLRLFIDGVIQGLPFTDANTYFAGSARTSVMGQAEASSIAANTGFAGWQDEFRLTKGVGRYTANFAPPTQAFPRNAIGDPNWLSVQWLSGWENGIFDDSSFGRTLTASAASSL